MHSQPQTGLARNVKCMRIAGNVTQQAAAMGALQALAVSHMGSPDLHRAWGTADVIPHLCARLRAAALPVRCLAAGALSNFALGCSDATVCAVSPVTSQPWHAFQVVLSTKPIAFSRYPCEGQACSPDTLPSAMCEQPGV